MAGRKWFNGCGCLFGCVYLRNSFSLIALQHFLYCGSDKLKPAANMTRANGRLPYHGSGEPSIDMWPVISSSIFLQNSAARLITRTRKNCLRISFHFCDISKYQKFDISIFCDFSSFHRAAKYYVMTRIYL